MPRLDPLPPEHTPELRKHFEFFLTTLGFAPNSVLTMQRRPKLVQAFAQLNAAVMDPAGKVELGLRRLIGHLATALWDFRTSALYSEKERVALEFALAAAQQPNAVTDELFALLRRHWSEEEIVEILGARGWNAGKHRR